MKHDLTQHEAAQAQGLPRQDAVSATRRVYPRLIIGGVYRMRLASGLAVYALPACAGSISRHRARLRLRRVRQALLQALTPSGADNGRARTRRILTEAP